MQRRSFLASVAALSASGIAMTSLAGCDPTGPSTTTVQGIIDWLVKNCNFSTNVASVVSVALSFAANFNPALGPAAPVDGFVANLVEQAICNQVKAHTAQAKVQKTEHTGRVVLTVNGVKVEGQLT